MTQVTVTGQVPYALSISDGGEVRQGIPTVVEMDERIQQYIDSGMVVLVPDAPIAPAAPAADTTKPRATAARQDSQEN